MDIYMDIEIYGYMDIEIYGYRDTGIDNTLI